MPIVDKLAAEYEISKFYLLLSMTIAVGYGIILPIASPSNAVVFTSGHVGIKDMVNILESISS